MYKKPPEPGAVKALFSPMSSSRPRPPAADLPLAATIVHLHLAVLLTLDIHCSTRPESIATEEPLCVPLCTTSMSLNMIMTMPSSNERECDDRGELKGYGHFSTGNLHLGREVFAYKSRWKRLGLWYLVGVE